MPDQTRASTISSIACEKRVKLRVRPALLVSLHADPVGPEELLERLHDRAAEPGVPRGVLRVGRVGDQRHASRPSGSVRGFPSAVGLLDRGDRPPERPVRLVVPDADQGVRRRQVQRREEAARSRRATVPPGPRASGRSGSTSRAGSPPSSAPPASDRRCGSCSSREPTDFTSSNSRAYLRLVSSSGPLERNCDALSDQERLHVLQPRVRVVRRTAAAPASRPQARARPRTGTDRSGRHPSAPRSSPRRRPLPPRSRAPSTARRELLPATPRTAPRASSAGPARDARAPGTPPSPPPPPSSRRASPRAR